jgi:HTH-type transcriptional regulator/antitoxin HipB
MLAIASMKSKVFDPRELGEALRRARRAKRMTQIELAQSANVARSAVQKLEEGRGTVNLDTVLKLLRTLSLDLEIVSRSSAYGRTSEKDPSGS